jgi:hypothetical protein
MIVPRLIEDDATSKRDTPPPHQNLLFPSPLKHRTFQGNKIDAEPISIPAAPASAIFRTLSVKTDATTRKDQLLDPRAPGPERLTLFSTHMYLCFTTKQRGFKFDAAQQHKTPPCYGTHPENPGCKKPYAFRGKKQKPDFIRIRFLIFY